MPPTHIPCTYVSIIHHPHLCQIYSAYTYTTHKCTNHIPPTFTPHICQRYTTFKFPHLTPWQLHIITRNTKSISAQNDVLFVSTLICFERVHVLFMLFVFINVYWCPTRFSYQMMSLSFTNSTTDLTCGAGTANPSKSNSRVRVARILVFCVMFCRSLFVPFSVGHFIVCPLSNPGV